jgi:hypothetical protein
MVKVTVLVQSQVNLSGVIDYQAPWFTRIASVKRQPIGWEIRQQMGKMLSFI